MSTPKSKKIKIRRRWKIKPQTRIKESAKCYSRTRAKKEIHEAIRSEDKKGT